MDFGDAQKESIDKGSEVTSLKGAENSRVFLQHNDAETVISHNKPKKCQFKCYCTRYFSILLSIFPLSYYLLYSTNLDHFCIMSTIYVYTPRDITVIVSIMFAPKKTKSVGIASEVDFNY